jgi:putative FmdB family regulatory protein
MISRLTNEHLLQPAAAARFKRITGPAARGELSDQLHRFPIIPYFAATFCGSTAPMPIYAYRCAACGHTKDVLRKLSDPPLADCPACGAPRFEKQVTAAGFQLKGSGWYVTDFRNPQAATAAAKPEADKQTADKPATDKVEKAATGGAAAVAPAASTPAAVAAPAAPSAPAPSTPGPSGDAS